MAHVVTTHGLEYMLSNDMGAADIRMAVFVGAAPAAATVREYDTVDSLVAAMTEAAATNYVRQDLASVTLTEEDGSDNATITAAAPTINAVGSGETWTTVAYYVHVTDDTDNILLSVDELAASVATNGGNITLPALSYTIAQA